jgi:hypothetical protein
MPVKTSLDRGNRAPINAATRDQERGLMNAISRVSRKLIAMVMLAASLVPAGAADLYQHGSGIGGKLHALKHAIGRDYTSLACDDASMLASIKYRFIRQAKLVHHQPDLTIRGFSGIHEHRYLAKSEMRPIAKRYCGAKVHLSDGHSRDLWYLIEDGMGFASVGDKVEFCISGLDRWNVYDRYCRVLR